MAHGALQESPPSGRSTGPIASVGMMNSSIVGEIRAYTLVSEQPVSPEEATPMSSPASVKSGPPLSPTQLTAGFGLTVTTPGLASLNSPTPT
ncbi:MAG: hypothetical protein WBM74_07890, partial [Polyangiales bacterium]